MKIMVKRKQMAILCCLAMAALPHWGTHAAAGEPIRIITSNLPPLSSETAPGAPGALHEIVTELLRR